MRLLLVEDEHRLAERLARGLREEGFATDIAGSAAAASDRVIESDYDLVLLDIGLPDGSGIDLLRAWRRKGLEMPTLILTAHDLVKDKVEGLNAGADDYLTKPFAFEELLARIGVLLRRRPLPPRAVIEVGGIRLDRDGHTATAAGHLLDLSPKEFALLAYFLLHPGIVLSRKRIAEHVWGATHESRSNTIDVIVGRLRRKLAAEGAGRSIKSKPGMGYVLRPAGPGEAR